MTEKDDMKKYIRDGCSYIWDKMDIFSKHIPKKVLVDGISLTRKILSNPSFQAKYPKVEEIYDEWIRHNLERYAELAEFQPLQCASEMGRLKALVEFPKRYHDNYDDMFPKLDENGKPMMSEHQFFDFRLKEEQAKVSDLDYEQAYIDRESKKFKNEYKKYVKEWKAKHD